MDEYRRAGTGAVSHQRNRAAHVWPQKPAFPTAPGPPTPQYQACASSPPPAPCPVPASALPPGAHSSWAPSSARSQDASVEGFFVQTLPAPECPPP